MLHIWLAAHAPLRANCVRRESFLATRFAQGVQKPIRAGQALDPISVPHGMRTPIEFEKMHAYPLEVA
jgi:hypothetical protein